MQLRYIALLWLSMLSFSASAQKYLEMMESGTFTITAIQQEAEAYFDVVGRGQGSGYKQFKRWEYVALMEMDETGVKISNMELTQRAREYRRVANQSKPESVSFSGNWKQLGPTSWSATSGWNPGIGRVSSIGIDITNTNHLIVGSPSGGVWKTLDGGATWTPLTDNFTTVDVYSLEISPYNSNHYFWGSSSGVIFRSTDAGASWASTGNVASGRVSRIQFHPTDQNVMYAVSESSGLYRSMNGGSTWSAVAGVSSIPGYDVDFKPGDPNTIYFSGTSVYRSTNGGTSFSQIGGFGTANNNYKMVGVSPANPNVVYVLESAGSKFGAFYKSTNSGASFNMLVDGNDINYFGYSSTGDDDKGQAPRDMDVAVNPSNANEVHIAGVHTWKSMDGGVSFSLTSHWMPNTAASLGVGYNHADIAILKYFGSTLYVGSDGGIYISTDGAETFVDRSTGLGIREFYKIGVSKTDPNVVSGGAQDNGTSVMRGANRAWVDWLGADGMESFVDWNNANILYGTSQYGSMYRSTNQGNSRSSISKPTDVGDGAWVTPFEQDPQVSTTIYCAFADVWKSTDSGGSWTKISNFDNGNMAQMKLAPSNNQRIYVSRGSSLFTTGNGGSTWATPSTPWGSSTINYISVHPQNPQRLLIVTSSSVYHSTDAGINWTNISTGLPSGSKYCATWEDKGKNGIYVGGFGTLSYTNDDLGGQWVGFFDGLPNVRVYELEINYVSNTIFAGTYGRGLWESPLYQASAPVAAFNADQRQGCRELTVTFTDLSTNNPNAWEWTFEGGTPSTSTLQHPTVTFSGSGAHTVRLKSFNAVGDNTFEAVDYITLMNPSAPAVSDVQRCGTGEVILGATGAPGEQFNWYASTTDAIPLFTGALFSTNIAQTTTFYAAAGNSYTLTQHIGPTANAIGDGGNHAGGYYLILDVAKPLLLKSAIVYATGAGDRTFQLLDANDNVLLEKTIFVNEGKSRVILDMNIPQGVDLQIGCPTGANLFRNSSGVNYPYTLSDLMQIKSSSAGSAYYYYLYDLEIESAESCESDRVAVTGVVHSVPPTPVITASGATTLCPGTSTLLAVDNACADCIVHWSNGETGPSISITSDGIYTATVSNTCGESMASNVITVATSTIPAAPVLSAAGATILCPGESVALLADHACTDCTVQWSTDETGSSINIFAEGTYTATISNTCGESLVSNAIMVTTAALPVVPVLSADGATTLCPGESVLLTATNACLDCTILWSNGATEPGITVSTEGIYTAISGNNCGVSPASNGISITTAALPVAPELSASGTTMLCPGESVQLTADNLCSGCTVLWSNGATDPGILVSTEGIYTAISGNNCGVSPASNGISITTAALPVAPELSASGTTMLCPGESVLLTADNLCSGCTVLWSTGATDPSILVSTEGIYTAISGNSCGVSPASNSISITTAALPVAPELSASGTTMLCPGESVLLTADNLCSDCTILWSNGTTAPSLMVSTEGTYTATASNTCGESPLSNGITVTNYPPFVPVVQVNNICELTAPMGSNYQWFLNGQEIPGATAQVWSAQVAGQYMISMFSPEGCPGASVPVFAEACVSGAMFLDGGVSARVYPNPAQDRVFLDIQTISTMSVQFELFAMDGRFVGQLYQGEILTGGQLLEIALPELSAGIYRYRLSSQLGILNGNLVVRKY